MSNLGKVEKCCTWDWKICSAKWRKFNNSFCQKNKYLSVKKLDHF